jgi:hypothetical protein
MFDQVDINCPNYRGHHSVVKYHNGYICTSCYQYADDYGVCVWCQVGQLGGVPEHSYLSGCDFCGGRSGWEKE